MFPHIFPKPENKNRLLCITDAGSEKPFMLLATDRIADLHIVGAGASSQCFPRFSQRRKIRIAFCASRMLVRKNHSCCWQLTGLPTFTLSELVPVRNVS